MSGSSRCCLEPGKDSPPRGWLQGFRCARPSGVPRGPATSTGSLDSQRHTGKFPKVAGRRRGTRGCPAAPRESFFNASRGPSPLPCKRRIPLAVVLPRPARGAGTLIPSAQRLVCAAKHLGVAFQAPPGSQASSRGEAKDSALLSSRDAGLLEPPERPQGQGTCSESSPECEDQS